MECEEQHPFDYMFAVDGDKLLCSNCYWNGYWTFKEVRKFAKRRDPRQPVLDLIDRLQGEAGHASMGEVYATVYSAYDVHLMLDEIQQAVEDMEV